MYEVAFWIAGSEHSIPAFIGYPFTLPFFHSASHKIIILVLIPNSYNLHESFSLNVQALLTWSSLFPFRFFFHLVSPFLSLLALSPSLPFSFSPIALSIAPSLPVVKQQGPCDSKLRKLPIKGNMSLTRESQGESVVCIIAKERVIWRHLSWTGQFPVSQAGQKYPEKKKKKIQEEGKGYTSFSPHVTSHNHFATEHNFAMAK